MVWFKTDDAFYSHPKVLSIPRPLRAAAIGTWLLAGTWSAAHLTDGAIPAYMLDELASTPDAAAALVEAQLWEATPEGFRFRSWAEYQPTRSEVEGAREAERRRKAAYREAKRGDGTPPEPDTDGSPASVPPGHLRDTPGRPDGTTPGVPGLSNYPDPTRPDPDHIEEQEIADAISRSITADAATDPAPGTELMTLEPAPPPAPKRKPYPDGFEDFWHAYPRHEAKRRAFTAWQAALRRTDADAILAGATRYAADPNREEQFTAHPATWLNRDGWEDAPLPRRRPESQQARLEESHAATLATLHQMGVA